MHHLEIMVSLLQNYWPHYDMDGLKYYWRISSQILTQCPHSTQIMYYDRYRWKWAKTHTAVLHSQTGLCRKKKIIIIYYPKFPFHGFQPTLCHSG